MEEKIGRPIPPYDLNVFLERYMHGVSLEDIEKKDEKWCFKTWTNIEYTASKNHFTNELLLHPQQSPAHFISAIVNRLKAFGWRFEDQ